MFSKKMRTQKIYITCFVEHGNKVLLLRGNEYEDEASRDNIMYFGLPRFTLTFGSDPTEKIKEEIEKQFGQIIDDIQLLNTNEYMKDLDMQIIELIYKVSVKKASKEQVGRFFFAEKNKLSNFMFPDELEKILYLISQE